MMEPQSTPIPALVDRNEKRRGEMFRSFRIWTKRAAPDRVVRRKFDSRRAPLVHLDDGRWVLCSKCGQL